MFNFKMTLKMKTINVVAAVIFKDGKIFATQRGYGAFKDGWEFPGGKVEPGELVEAALRRELQEELGIEVTACHPWLRRQFMTAVQRGPVVGAVGWRQR